MKSIRRVLLFCMVFILTGIKVCADDPGEAQRFYLKKRLRQGDTLSVEKYFEARRRLASMPVFSSAEGRLLSPQARSASEDLLAGISSWSSLGPGNIGGRTRVLVTDPSLSNTMYAGAASGGIWKTTNGGNSWTSLDDFLPDLAVNALVLDVKSPVNARVLYAGTGEGYLNSDAIRGAGIFKSTDGGAKWTRLASTTTPDFAYVNDLVISPTDSQVVYAATRTGVWKSTNGGTAWTQVLNSDGTGGAKATLARTRDDTGMLDLAIRTDTPAAKDVVFATSGSFLSDGVYRTTDSGSTWARVLTAPDIGRSTLAIAPGAQETIYALSAKTTSRVLNVFRSTDGGTTWSPRIAGTFDPNKLEWLLLTNPLFASSLNCLGSPNSFLNQGWHDNVIAVSPSNPETVFVGGVDLFRSDDGGATFGTLSYWWIKTSFPQYLHADQHSIVFDPNWNGAANQTLFVGNDGGVFKTTNSLAAVATGENRGLCFFPPSIPGLVEWKSLNNGYAVTQFYHGAVYPDGKGVFGGTQDNGVVQGTATEPNNWSMVLDGDGGFCAVDPTTSGNSTVLYAENTGLSIQKSVDNGETFTRATAGINDAFGFITPFAIDPRQPQILWTAGFRPWRTVNGTEMWTPAKSSDLARDPVSAIGISPSESATVYMGTVNGDIFRTANGLDEEPVWTQSTGLPRAWCSWVSVDPKDPNTAYATFSTFGVGHVWKTTNGGVNWMNLDGKGDKAVPDIPVNCIVVHPTATNVLYLGTDLGVLVSIDGGQSWNVENTGFANAPTETLVWEPTATPGNLSRPPVLYAFTHGRGVYRTEVSLNPPRTPAPFFAQVALPTEIDLSWSDNNSNETGFLIERRDFPSGVYAVIVTTPPNVTAFHDGVKEGRRYAYRIRAVSEGGYSPYSSEVVIQSPGTAAPTNLRALAISLNETKITWSDPGYNTNGFFLERKVGTSGDYERIALLLPTTTSFSDSRIIPGLTYYYRVKAFGFQGDSAYSNEDTPIPAAPTNLKAQAVSFNRIDLTWVDNTDKETAYIVERMRENSGWTVLATLRPNSTRFSNTTVSPETQYFYRVKAIHPVISSAYSNEVSVKTDPVPDLPLPPANLTVKAASTTQVALEWTDTSSNETGFQIERRKGAQGEFSTLTTTASNVTHFEDNRVMSGTLYGYRVRAVNAGGNSPVSNEVSATTAGIAPPTNLSAQGISASEISLSWTDNSFNETGFLLERKKAGTATYTFVATTGANLTFFKDTGLAAKTQYVYRVKAINSEGESTHSNEVTVTTKPAAPIITEITPKKGRIGSLVTLIGANFENAVVMVGTVRVGLLNATAERFQLIVPPNPRGNVTITVTTPGGSTITNFRVK